MANEMKRPRNPMQRFADNGRYDNYPAPVPLFLNAPRLVFFTKRFEREKRQDMGNTR